MRTYPCRVRSEAVIYKGITFRRYPDSKNVAHRNYYRPHAAHIKKGVGHLHQEIWKDAHGPIPEGHVIHHRDLNPLNNAPDNLQCVTEDEHKRIHAALGTKSTPAVLAHLEEIRPLAAEWHASEEGREWHSEHARRQWATRKPEERTCDHCKRTYSSILKGRQRFCSTQCAEKARPPRKPPAVRPTACVRCGAPITPMPIGKPRLYCSTKCRDAQFRERAGGGL